MVTSIVPLHLTSLDRLNIATLWETEFPKRISDLSTAYPELLLIRHEDALQSFKMFWNYIFPSNNILIPRLNARCELTMDVNSELGGVTFSQIFKNLVGFAVKLTQEDCRILEKYGKEYVTYNSIPFYIFGTVTLLPDNLAGTTPNVKLSIDMLDHDFGEVKIVRLVVGLEMFTSLVVDKLNSPVLSNAAKKVLVKNVLVRTAAKEASGGGWGGGRMYPS